jgi:tetratricopeptide (TPR) repeat protein
LKALGNKGITLGRLNRSEEAIAVYDGVVSRFGSSDQPAVIEWVGSALLGKAITLSELNRSEEAVAFYDEVISNLGKRDQPALLQRVAWALVLKCVELVRLNRREEAIAACDEANSRFGSIGQPKLLNEVARALFYKGMVLGQLGRNEESMAVYDEVLARFGQSDQPELRSPVADSLAAQARYAFETEDYEAAIRISERALALIDRHAESIAIHIRALLRTGNASRAADFASSQLTGNPSLEGVRFAVARAFLEDCHSSKPILRQLRQLFAGDAETLAFSLLAWAQRRLPISEGEARNLEQTDNALHEVFGDIEKCSLGLRLFSAARLAALGDRKALFELPIEVRRLIHSESTDS